METALGVDGSAGFGSQSGQLLQPAVPSSFKIRGDVVAQSKGRDAISLSDFNAGGFLVFETKRVEAVKEVQTQLLDTFEQFNRQQLARGKQEMEFASEFAGEITSARSVPDVINAYQNWISKRMAFYMEDGKKLLEDSQRVLNTTMELLSIGKDSNSRLPISHATGSLGGNAKGKLGP